MKTLKKVKPTVRLEEERRKATFELRVDLLRRLGAAASLNDESIRDLVDRALERELSRMGMGPKKGSTTG
jgi:hypothetical protein